MQAVPWKIISPIGKGQRSRVYLAQNREDHKKYAIKFIFDHNENGPQITEVHSKLQHDSMIEYKTVVYPDELSFSTQEEEEKFRSFNFTRGYAMEYAPRGDLLSLMQNIQMLPEIVARTFISQLVDVLDYLHNQEHIAHNALYLQNLLLDSQFCLKLANFEASEIIALGKTANLTSTVFLKKENAGFAADMFALGIIIFELTCGYSPFSQAVFADDEVYALIQEERWEEFWKIQEEIYPLNPILKRGSLKELIQNLLCPASERRAKISDVRKSEWMKLIKVDKLNVESWIIEIAKKQKANLFISPL